MPQQSLGENAKNVVKSIRMTKTQERALINKYGSAQAALKHFVDNEAKSPAAAGAAR